MLLLRLELWDGLELSKLSGFLVSAIGLMSLFGSKFGLILGTSFFWVVTFSATSLSFKVDLRSDLGRVKCLISSAKFSKFSEGHDEITSRSFLRFVGEFIKSGFWSEIKPDEFVWLEFPGRALIAGLLPLIRFEGFMVVRGVGALAARTLARVM